MDGDRRPASERVTETEWPMDTAPGDWTTSPAMLDRLRRKGAAAWREHIAAQITSAELQWMTADAIAAARADGRLDRVLYEGR